MTENITWKTQSRTSVINSIYTYLVMTERKYIRFSKKYGEIIPLMNGGRKRLINISSIF